MASKWTPDLAHRHPGYYKVVLSLIFVHLALAADSTFRPLNQTPAYDIIGHLIGGQFWILGLLHFAVGMLLLVGLYRQFQLVRFGSALSAFTFNALAVGLACGEVINRLSFLPAICSLALSLSSVAAAREPRDGPGGTLA